ncbi:MAG: hypothetical protein AABX24_05400, partial [Nanoarchaeota archaeon]
MFKKIVLAGLLIILLSSVVFAEITINTEKAPEVIVKTDEDIVKTDEDFPVTSNDFWIWLEVPENLPAPGGSFLMDIYITSYQQFLSDFKIKLVPNNKKVKFTNALVNSKYSDFFTLAAVTSSYDPSDWSATISLDLNSKLSVYLGRKYFLRSLQMEVFEPGSFRFSLDKENSIAEFKDQYDSVYKFVLKQGNTRVVRNTLCVP